jgi:rRNA maturation endonuclease Nob1
MKGHAVTKKETMKSKMRWVCAECRVEKKSNAQGHIPSEVCAKCGHHAIRLQMQEWDGSWRSI